MSNFKLTGYIHDFIITYSKLYPVRNVTMINTLTHGADRQPLPDTGICFGLAITLKTLMHLKHGTSPELVYVYRKYNATNGDGFEDSLVHCVLLLDGLYYDAINTEGVDCFSSLWFIRSFYKPHEHYIVYPERRAGCRDSIPNKITPELYAAFERAVDCSIERIDSYK